MLLQKLESKKLIHPPKWLCDNTVYLTVMGSTSYGVATDQSDWDIYGVTIPRKEEIFRHLKNEIEGFGRQKQRFEQYIEHGPCVISRYMKFVEYCDGNTAKTT